MNDQEYVTRCVVDPLYKTVRIYSNEGTEQELVCDTADEFINVVKFIRSTVDDNLLDDDQFVYASPV
jgi:hypothetical protein